MILLGWGWGVQRLSFYHQVISFKSLEPPPVVESWMLLSKARITVITVVTMLDYLLNQGCLPRIRHAVGSILAFNQFMLSLTLGFLLLKHTPCSAFVSNFVLSLPNYVVTLLYNHNFILIFTKHTIRMIIDLIFSFFMYS